jgi:hypothetical protein
MMIDIDSPDASHDWEAARLCQSHSGNGRADFFDSFFYGSRLPNEGPQTDAQANAARLSRSLGLHPSDESRGHALSNASNTSDFASNSRKGISWKLA